MRPHVVVVVARDGQIAPGIGQAVEQLLIQQFIAQRAIEGPVKPVLLGLALIDVMPFDLVLACPFQDGPAGKFSRKRCFQPRVLVMSSVPRFAV